MIHTHKCEECHNVFDCPEEELSERECELEMKELEDLPTCDDCQGL